MAIINTRSPFFVSITDSSISYATLDIEIYTGDKTSDFTGTPDYELKKSKIGSNTTLLLINVLVVGEVLPSSK